MGRLISRFIDLSNSVLSAELRAAWIGRARAELRRLGPLWRRGRDARLVRAAFVYLRYAGTRRRRAMDAISASILRDGEFAWPGWTASLCLHLFFFVGVLVAWTMKPQFSDRSTALVPVDLVSVAQETNVAPAAKPAQHQADFAQIAPVEVTTSSVQIAAPPQANDAAQADIEPDATAQNPQGESLRQTQQEPQAVQARQDSASSRIVPGSPPQAAPSSFAPPDARLSQRLVQGEGPRDASTASLMAILNSQIAACWSPPPTAPRAEQFAVELVLRLNPNGTIAAPPQLAGASAAAAPHDASVRAAADAARQAIYSCAPYRLPGSMYDEWRVIASFRFDPAATVGSSSPAR